ncbi:MAG: histidine phosphatase family protein [Clostridia bacterium]|nr:histidine phosphatase family protein [Clostridia bacterium]
MVRFILVRHGYSQFNKENRFTGHLDVHLDEVGLWQAERVGDYLFSHYQIDAIYSSDLSRAVATAEPTACLFGLPIQKRKDLRETDVGRWGGCYFERVKEEFPEEYAIFSNDRARFTYPDGESSLDVVTRVSKALDEIAKENNGKTVMIATHGGVLRCMLCVWNGYDIGHLMETPPVMNASITVIEYENGEVRLKEVGFTGHLEDRVGGANLD